ncbi:MAG: hypothetical protein SO445_06065 [Lachnospiraceae bacterium]|nr:hypothetical protein [Lachnospiraceae bacterium]
MLVERAELSDVAVIGLKIGHKKFGPGTVISQDGNIIIVKFGEEEKKFSLPMAFSAGFLVCEDKDVIDLFTEQDKLDKEIKTLKGTISTIEMQLKRM